MSELWGAQTELSLYLEQNGIDTLLFDSVNSDQAGDVFHVSLLFQSLTLT